MIKKSYLHTIIKKNSFIYYRYNVFFVSGIKLQKCGLNSLTKTVHIISQLFDFKSGGILSPTFQLIIIYYIGSSTIAQH